MTKKDLEILLDFIVIFSKEMILAGANLERVELFIHRICEEYGVYDESIFLLSKYIYFYLGTL